jgi:copper resistance protein B
MNRLLAIVLCLTALAVPAAAQAPAPPHQHPSPPAPTPPPSPAEEDHSAHQPAAGELPPFIPPVTDADRAAAFPDVMGHSVHDSAVNYFVLFDQLEWRGGSGGGLSWDNRGWIGKDRHRFWFRTEGEADAGRLAMANAHALYGRAISRWWDVVAGVRQDARPGGAQTWAAIGVQGLAPYFFEVQATAYLGAAGRTHLRVETEYELLLTNRLILQPLVELDIDGKGDPDRRLGAGLTSVEAGLRIRYEFRREVAPYIGVTWHRRFFGTADQARSAGESIGSTRLAVGLRVWK